MVSHISWPHEARRKGHFSVNTDKLAFEFVVSLLLTGYKVCMKFQLSFVDFVSIDCTVQN